MSESASLLDVVSYTKPSELKPLIKFCLTSDNLSGDASELCISADLKTILGLYDSSKDLKVLTSKQKKVIVEHVVNDKTQAELAKELNITQQGVSILLCSALRRIKNYILDGELKWTPWSDNDKDKLMSRYGKTNIHLLSKELGKPPSKVISMYHYLKNKQNKEAKGGT
jgi:predicted DNA-binding protein YlxM (UPF0122 family)